MMPGQWVVVEGSPRQRRLPKWKRSLFISEDGVIYAPAAVAGGEMEVFLCAGYDGTKVLQDNENHTYYPLEWLKREFPKARGTCETIERRLNKEGML
jgi:hypothetical protein